MRTASTPSREPRRSGPTTPSSRRNREWLAALPQGPIVVDDLVEICHGSPIDEDLYIFDETDALRALKSMTRPLCLFGHTHFPITFQLAGGELQAIGPERIAGGRRSS